MRSREEHSWLGDDGAEVWAGALFSFNTQLAGQANKKVQTEEHQDLLTLLSCLLAEGQNIWDPRRQSKSPPPPTPKQSQARFENLRHRDKSRPTPNLCQERRKPFGILPRRLVGGGGQTGSGRGGFKPGSRAGGKHVRETERGGQRGGVWKAVSQNRPGPMKTFKVHLLTELFGIWRIQFWD